nr:DDE-type integrase/transposase/recombinase [Deinococcus humi]
MHVFLQEDRNTEVARSFFGRLLSEYDVPGDVHTDKLRSYGTALRNFPRAPRGGARGGRLDRPLQQPH